MNPQNGHYFRDYDEAEFKVEVIKPPLLQFQNVPDELDLVEGATVDLTVTVSGSNPLPDIEWLLNTAKAAEDEIKVVESDQKRDRNGDYVLTQSIRYTAKLEDNAKKLICRASQADSRQNVEIRTLETLLRVQAQPAPEPAVLGTSVIVGIVSAAVLLLLLIILLLIAYRTRRLCFRKPGVIIREVERERARQHSMQVQADVERNSAAVGTAFGPEKPLRAANSKENLEGAPLIRKERLDLTDKDKAKLEAHLTGANDEIKEFEYEGSGNSRCTSFSSLNTSVSDADWEETFRALGPKFQHLADLAGGKDDSGTECDASEKFGETEL